MILIETSTEPTSVQRATRESKLEFTLLRLTLGLSPPSLVYPEVGDIMDIPMSKHTLIKVVCLLVYTGLIMLVPDMPNIYTFIINCLGFIVTMSASVLLFRYLNSRPPAQKNILNRILALLILLLAALTIRSLLTSFVACFWSIHLSEIVKRYPILTTAVLSYRLYVLAITVTVCTLSCGRLLLVTNPVLFHNIRHSSCGAIVAGALVLLVYVLDLTHMSLVCNENTNTRPLFNFKIEMGIMTQDDFKTTIPVTDNPNATKSESEKKFCNVFPTFPVLLICSLFMETVKVLFVLVKEFLKMKKKNNQVRPTELIKVITDQSDILRTNSGPSGQPALRRSESFPLPYTARIVSCQRRYSLQAEEATGPEALVVDSTENQNTPNCTIENLNRAAEGENLMLAKEVITKQCMRTASIVTIFIVAGLCGSLIITSPTSGVVELTLSRLTAYNLVVYLVLFDKDVLFYFFSLLGFSL